VDSKTEFIALFETVVLPLIPEDWKFGDNLSVVLEYSSGECGGWDFGTGPIGGNHAEYKKMKDAFFGPMLKLASKMEGIKEENYTSASLRITYNRVTKEIYASGVVNVEISKFNGNVDMEE
jgi:hypothetical protein